MAASFALYSFLVGRLTVHVVCSSNLPSSPYLPAHTVWLGSAPRTARQTHLAAWLFVRPMVCVRLRCNRPFTGLPVQARAPALLLRQNAAARNGWMIRFHEWVNHFARAAAAVLRRSAQHHSAAPAQSAILQQLTETAGAVAAAVTRGTTSSTGTGAPIAAAASSILNDDSGGDVTAALSPSNGRQQQSAVKQQGVCLSLANHHPLLLELCGHSGGGKVVGHLVRSVR